jgi:tetratricopeptide (TPR) repeat protein
MGTRNRWTRSALAALFIFYTMGPAAAGLSAFGRTDGSLAWMDWWSKGTDLARVGDCAGAANAFRQSLAFAEGTAIDPRQLAAIYDSLGSAEADLGRFIESGRAYERGLALVEQSEGRGSISYALLLGDLAVLPTQSNRVGEATELLRAALETAGPDAHTRDFAACRHILVYLLVSHERYRDAEPFVRASLAILDRYQPGDDLLRAEFLNELGVIRLYLGKYREAVDLLRESLRLSSSSSGTPDPHLVTILNNLATAYTKNGNLPEAEDVCRRALPLCEKSLGNKHPSYGVLLENYSVILRQRGRKREARTMAAQSREITRSSNRSNGIGMTVDAKSLH